MPTNKQEPSRLELIKAGKLHDERRAPRAPLAQHAPDSPASDTVEGGSIRPEAIALALLVILLLALTLIWL